MLQNTFLLIVYFFLFTEQNNLNMYLTRLLFAQLNQLPVYMHCKSKA